MLLSEAFLIIGVYSYALWRLVVTEWLRRRFGSIIEDFAGIGVYSVDFLIGELCRFVYLL